MMPASQISQRKENKRINVIHARGGWAQTVCTYTLFCFALTPREHGPPTTAVEQDIRGPLCMSSALLERTGTAGKANFRRGQSSAICSLCDAGKAATGTCARNRASWEGNRQ